MTTLARWCRAFDRHLLSSRFNVAEREHLRRIEVVLHAAGAIFTDDEWRAFMEQPEIPTYYACKATRGEHVIAPDEAIPWEVEEDPTLATKSYDGTCMACGEGGYPFIEPPTKCGECGALYSFRYECPRCDPVTT